MSNPTLLILAATTSEAYAYCHRAKIPTRDRRIVMRRGQIIGFRTAVVHALPSFHTAAHRHSILSGLKHIKVEWIDVEMPEKPVEDQGDGMGEQLALPPFASLPVEGPATLVYEGATEREHEVAIRYDQLRDVALVEAERLDTLDHLIESAETTADTEEPDGEPTGTPEPSEDAAPAPTRKRRSRCKACGELKDLDGHDCPLDPAVAAEPAAAGPAEPEDVPVVDMMPYAGTDGPDGDSDGFF